MPTVDGAFAKYRQSYSARSPDTSEVTYDDEDRQLTPAEGLQSFDVPPCKNIVLGVPPAKDGEAAGEKYLWAIMPKAIPFALELLPGIVLKRGRLAHTNLTGGADAHCGGEVWFIDSERIVINGGSGRYRPRSSEELEAVARAFKESGYKVASMGWDFGVDAPARSVRGEIKWL